VPIDRPRSARIRHWFRSRVHAAVRPLADASADARAGADRAQAATQSAQIELRGLEETIARLDRALDRRDGPFVADMTVDEAWRRHPGARGVFAARHLPNCDGCAVRFDETLTEVADAYAFDLGALLDDLNRLISAADGTFRPPQPL
jgi:hypothetical protein